MPSPIWSRRPEWQLGVVRLLLRLLRAYFPALRETLLVIALTLIPSIAFSQQVQHVYDENGRLVGTIAPNGEGARWTYDAAGNITRIDRFTATQISLFEFTPNSGAVGSTVTIWGTGFSATPAQNTVQFNGVTATVSAATANKLTVVVPATATTGTISVTSPNGSVASSGPFTVAAAIGAPTISTLSLATIRPGNTLTITGTGFSTTLAENKVRINGNFARVTTASATQLQVLVAPVHLGGKVSVTTPQGTATSTADVFAVPEAYVLGTVGHTARVALGTTATIPFNSTNRMALVVFDAVRGQRLRYRTVSLTSGFAPSAIEIYSPDGERIHSAPTTVGSQVLFEPLSESGTYTLYMSSGGTTGTATAVVDVLSTPLVLDGTPTAYSWTSTGPQQGGFVFTGDKDAKLGLGLSVTSLVGNVSVRVFDPTGRMLLDSGGFAGPNAQGLSLDLPALVVPGPYLVVVDHASSSSGNVSLTLSNDATAALTPGAAPLAFAIDRAGKNGRFTFTGQTGEYFSAATELLSGLSFSPGVSIRILKPNGGDLPLNVQPVNPNAYVADTMGPLPVGGTYTVLFSPIGVQTGTANVRLQKSFTATLAPGTSVPFSLGPAQNARFSFTPTGSTDLNFGLGLSITTPSPPLMYLTVRNASGALVASTNGGGSALSLNLPNLTAGEAYTAELDPSGIAAISGSILLTQDKTGTLTLNAAGTDFVSDGIGQNGRYSFDVTVPPTRNWGIGITPNVPLSGFLSYEIRRPNGSVYTSGGLSGPGTGGISADLSGLGATDVGTWTVWIDPTQATVPNVKLTLSSDVEESIAVNSSTPKTFTSSLPGRNARYTFPGTLGRRMSLVVTARTGFEDGVTVQLLRASSGQAVGTAQVFYNAGDLLYFDLLPGTESYVLFVSPSNGRTGSLSVRLLESQQFAIVAGAAPSNFTPAFPGQVGRVTFSPASGAVHLGRGTTVVTPSAAGTTTVRTFGPSGEIGGATSFATQSTGSGSTGDLSNSTVGGQYAVELRPDAGGTPTLQLTLSTDIAGTVTPGGAPVTFTTSRSGQNGRYTFTASSGQKVNLTVNSGGSWGQVYFVLQRPDFSYFQAPSFGPGGGTWQSGTLDTTGSWTVYITPVEPNTGSVGFSLTLQ